MRRQHVHCWVHSCLHNRPHYHDLLIPLRQAPAHTRGVSTGQTMLSKIQPWLPHTMHGRGPPTSPRRRHICPSAEDRKGLARIMRGLKPVQETLQGDISWSCAGEAKQPIEASASEEPALQPNPWLILSVFGCVSFYRQHAQKSLKLSQGPPGGLLAGHTHVPMTS